MSKTQGSFDSISLQGTQGWRRVPAEERDRQVKNMYSIFAIPTPEIASMFQKQDCASELR